MNFDYDPSRHPLEVKRVLERMKFLILSTNRDTVAALTDGIEFVAKQDVVPYEQIKKIVFAAIKESR